MPKIDTVASIFGGIALVFSGLFFLIDAKASGPIQEARNIAENNKQEIADVWKHITAEQQRQDKKEEIMVLTLREILGRVSRIEGMIEKAAKER